MYNRKLDIYLAEIQLYERSIVITEDQMMQYLLEMPDLSKKVTDFISWGEKKLKSLHNISLDPIKKLGKKQGEMLRREFKKGTSPEQLGIKVAKSAKSFMIKQVKQSYEKLAELNLGEKVLISIMAFFVIIFVNTLLANLLATVVSVETTIKVLGLVIAPMVEEAAKNFFIQQGMPWIGTSVVFGIEAIQYIINLFFMGANVGKALILRLATFLLHLVTTFVQKRIIESGDEDESKALFIAWAAGVAIHASWNLFGFLINDKAAAFLGVK